jgi:Protein of unknown function (DUF3237)
MLETELFAEFAVSVGAPVKFGNSGFCETRFVPILGGTVTGKLQGKILAGGGDEQLIRADGLTHIHARYTIETNDGVLIRVDSKGVRSGPQEVMAALLRGEKVDAGIIYFRTAIRLETSDQRQDHLNHRIFVATGTRLPEHVLLKVYAV